MSTVDLEMGRRVWWSLAMEDWYAIPFRGVWCKSSASFYFYLIAVWANTEKMIAIHMDQFDTPLPSNCKDEDLQNDDYYTNRPLSVVAISS